MARAALGPLTLTLPERPANRDVLLNQEVGDGTRERNPYEWAEDPATPQPGTTPGRGDVVVSATVAREPGASNREGAGSRTGLGVNPDGKPATLGLTVTIPG